MRIVIGSINPFRKQFRVVLYLGESELKEYF